MQTTHSQPSKHNSLRCSHSHTLYAFPTRNRHGQHEVCTALQEHLHTSFLRVIKKRVIPLCPIALGCDGSTGHLSY